MQDNSKYVDFLSGIVKDIVKVPEDVRVEKKIDEMGTLLTLFVNPQDMGLVIGRAGETAKALRTLLRTIGIKEGARVFLKINDPKNSHGI